MPNLSAFGATEYMDGALTSAVLHELFLRGTLSRGRGRATRGRDLVMVDHSDPEEEDRERRRDYKELEALDFTGCVSAVFTKAIQDFVTTHLLTTSTSDSDNSEDESPVRRTVRFSTPLEDESLIFPSIRRLGLRGMKSVQSHILHPLVLAFPSLTHLDLSCTRVTPELLSALGSSHTIHLQSLAIERCNWLTGESIRKFLIESPVTYTLRELSLYGDWTFPSPLSEEDLLDIFKRAPSLKAGQLVYLDISSTPVTKQMLLDVCAPQPSLRSLGLSSIRHLELGAVAEFLKTKASSVEVLTLAMTSPDLGYGEQVVPPRQASIALHAQIVRPLCTPPFSFSLSAPAKAAKVEAPTRLRVIELSRQMLNNLGGGADSWRIVRSKGSRGWYVDAASGWVAYPVEGGDHRGRLRRDLERGHPWRAEVERLADMNGNVSSGVGWHARKMEV